MKEIDAWVFAALRRDDKLLDGTADACFECRDKPSQLLVGGSPRLVRSGKKHKSAYREVERQIVEGVRHAVRLSQVQRFADLLVAMHLEWQIIS